MTGEELFWNEIGEYSAEVINLISDLSQRSFIAITNLKTQKTWWSKRTVQFFSMDQNVVSIRDERVRAHVHPEDLQYYRSSFRERIEGKNLDTPIEYRMDMGDGKYRVFSARCSMMRDKSDENFLLVTMIDDYGIEGNIDSITGLHNGASFTKRVREITVKKEKAAFLKLGLNRFSNTNIMYGSEYGDEVLRKVAGVLLECVGEQDEVFRLSGAKFSIILRHADYEELRSLYEKIKYKLSEEIMLEGKKVPLGISAGGIYLGQTEWDSKEIRCRLTYALNHSKHRHNGNLVIFNEDMCENGKDNIELLSVIHQSAREDFEGFYLCYQPIADPASGKIRGMEALLRWKKEPYGAVPPGVFIEWLEEDPCIFELGNWIIRQAIRDAKKLDPLDDGIFVNVNVAAAQLERKEFAPTVLQILQEEDFPVSRFCLELTERCREMDLNELREVITEFRHRGIKVALDDFGTGNASLSTAMILPFDELKIDMSFVKEIEKQPIKQLMVRSIVDFAKKAKREVCVEGVENAQVFEFLRQYDATWFQGYYFSKPIRIEEFIALFQNS